jgi:hypothetical protein
MVNKNAKLLYLTLAFIAVGTIPKIVHAAIAQKLLLKLVRPQYAQKIAPQCPLPSKLLSNLLAEILHEYQFVTSSPFKGTVSRDFLHQFFIMNHLPLRQRK